MKTMVAVTAEELSVGVPDWGGNQNITQVPEGGTDVAIENLIAGRKYYVKTWNEDQFGNKSNELVRTIQTERPTRLYPLTFSANGQFDSGSAMYAYVKVPLAAKSISQVLVTLSFREFVATAQSADASGTLTSDSGGGATSGSGGSSTPTSGASSNSSSSNGTESFGLGFDATSGTSGAASAGTAHTHSAGSYGDANAVQTAGGHTHPIPHTHNVTITGHTHTTPDHQHSVPTHTHALVYGTFEEAFPASHSVFIKLYHREGSGWVLKATVFGFTYDLQDADLTSYFDAVGDWRIAIQSSGGTPQGGRLSCDVFGTVTVVMYGDIG